SKIDIVISPNNYSDAQVTCDGQTNLNLVPGDRVSIRKNETPVRLIHPAEHDYFQLLRAKLHWGKNL
ncbi:MAG: NAD(+) kinase, partial [Gammaproteobacteria bacterium]|nr:NAD(+) kinase [Gammaproteobacteria bacterium]